MSVPSAEDLDRWADGMVEGVGMGPFALVLLLAGADQGHDDDARALVALAGRRLRAGKPLPPLLADWVGKRLLAAAARRDGSVTRVLGRGGKPRDWQRVGEIYWRVETLRQDRPEMDGRPATKGLTVEQAVERTAAELGLSFDRVETVYKRARACPFKPVQISIGRGS